ncbi:glycoside hydrolase 15 protein, partial [Ceratobasidium sp. 392]
MRSSGLFYLVFACITCGFVTAGAVYKRQTTLPTANVQLQNYTLSGSAFSGNIYIKNLDYTKVVTVTYSNAANSWVSGQSISASYSYSISGTSYEIWTLSGTIGSGGIKQFYIRYDVSGSSYYDNNGTKNYDVTTSTTTSASTSTTKARTTTTSAATTTTTSRAITTTTSSVATSTSTSPSTSSVSTSYVPTPTNIPADLTPCNTWNGQDSCVGQQTEYNSTWDVRK